MINTMNQSAKPRGATAIDGTSPRRFHKHFLAIAVIAGGVALGTSLVPAGKVEAHRDASVDNAIPDTPQLAINTLLTHDAVASNIEPSAPAPLATTADPADTDPADIDSAVAISEAIPEQTPAEPEIVWAEQTVRSGDNLSVVFKRAGFGKQEVHQIVYNTPEGKQLSKIYPGQNIAFAVDGAGELLAVKHIVSPLETVVYSRESATDKFTTEHTLRQPEVRETWASGEIEISLFGAGKDMGLSQTKILELANIFGGVIDFVLDPRKGDTINVVYEELYLDGEKYKDGEILAASFTNQGETFTAYRYEDSEGDVGFYNADGVSMRKAFLMAPVDFTRISSNFNPNRLHPIYKTARPHRGTDYAAPTGTPVYAAGDGRVIKAGYTRPNGNYVFIQHGDHYVTRYLHLHKLKVKQGQRVDQSDVIGTVGATGAATGPHLHYEFLVDGVHRNPRTILEKLPKAQTLQKSEIPRFRESIGPAVQQLAALRTETRLALNRPAEDSTQR